MYRTYKMSRDDTGVSAAIRHHTALDCRTFKPTRWQ